MISFSSPNNFLCAFISFKGKGVFFFFVEILISLRKMKIPLSTTNDIAVTSVDLLFKNVFFYLFLLNLVYTDFNENNISQVLSCV